MAKDPAFLFYPGDWMGGTVTFTRAQKGAYIDLLMAQFNQVALSIDDIKLVLGVDFWMWEEKLKYKFETESQCRLYFNRKLRTEVIRRRLFTDSRNNNKEGSNQHKRGHMTTHMTTHMTGHTTGHMETETAIETAIEKDDGVQGKKEKSQFSPPALQEVENYCLERKNGVDSNKWHNFYTAKGWMIGKTKMVDWKAAVRNWEVKKDKFDEHGVPVEWRTKK